MSKLAKIAMAMVIPLVAIAIVGNVGMIRRIVFPAVPRFGAE